MKKILVIGCFALAAGAATAQQREGRVVYERTMQLQRPRAMANGHEMPIDMPRSRTDQYELLFGNNQSLYQFFYFPMKFFQASIPFYHRKGKTALPGRTLWC